MTDLRITIRNTSDTGGTFLTPLWFGAHDGSFDLFESGTAASAGLEQMAEDGNPAGLNAELTAADPDAVGGLVAGAAGPIATGETATATLTLDGSQTPALSFAAMLLPSNDAFIGTDVALDLFTASGRFRGETEVVLTGSDVYDAGTEVNTELDAAFINQTAPNTGETEGGVVTLHPGFNGSAGNPEGEQIILGGTNAFGAFIDPEAADFTLPGAGIAVVHVNTVQSIDGTDQRDILIGRRSDDIVHGGDGNDLILGLRGWDDLFGGAGNDRILGGQGDDLIVGGLGHDRLNGGRGDDRFVFATGDGKDVIGDFDRQGDDLILLSVEGVASFGDVLASARETKRGTLLEFGEGDSLLLARVDLDSLGADDFAFV